MCCCYSFEVEPALIAWHFGLEVVPEYVARYKIVPSQPIGIIVRKHASSMKEFTHVLWGLVPAWADDPAIGRKILNARCETAAEKPAFKSAMKYRRCIVPATGFYEWRKTGKHRQPFFIHRHDKQPLAMAALWEHWQSPDGSELETAAILTCEANDMMAEIHDRIPVILEPEDYDRWLDPDVQDVSHVADLMRPAEEQTLTMYSVSTLVNQRGVDSPQCMKPMEPETLF